ncbi:MULTISPECIES: Rieske (2Fe-2S) protein [unclassified Kitasatospora]|uniref:Rieske (2Fe-2S) protein n=1 Tax=unclassified Kitasatospora TaxID=2633591 RepID=UPI00340D8622
MSENTTGNARRTVPGRRAVLCGMSSAAAVALCGCSSSTTARSTAEDSATPAESGAGEDGAVNSTAPTAGGPATPGSSAMLGKAADVPVGGGMIFPAAKVVVTQSATDLYRGFSAVCTHRGCTVSGVADGLITCPCHGSAFRIEDGSVAKGPATSPLAPVPVKVHDGALVVGG